MYWYIKIFCIFVVGLGWSNYQLKADVLTVAPFLFSTSSNISTMNQEIFKQIITSPKYEVSDLGRVRTIKSGIIRIGNNDGNGYLKIQLNGSTYRVHRLVAKAFIINTDNKPTVNHKNGIKSDNKVKNLEWATRKENTNHAYKTGLMANLLSDETKSKRNNSNTDKMKSTNTTGYVGICKHYDRYEAYVKINKKNIFIKSSCDLNIVLKARNKYITENNLINHLIQ